MPRATVRQSYIDISNQVNPPVVKLWWIFSEYTENIKICLREKQNPNPNTHK